MEYRRLGNSGLKLSALSFGSWVTFGNQVNTTLAESLLGTAFDAGMNFFDNAVAFAHGESEVIMGAAIKRLNLPRDQYCISSKVFWGGETPTQLGLSRKHVMEACHAALKRLQVDHLDLYFCHRPDPETPIEETVWAMHHLIQQGKVLYWGTSEWSADDIMQAYTIARQYNLTPPTMEQPQYNMFTREKVEIEFSKLYQKIGYGTTIWSPLASGLLTGKYNDGIPKGSRASLPDYAWLKERIQSDEGQKQITKVKQLSSIAKQLNYPLADIAIAWCLKNPQVSTVILGASTLKQLQQNLKALEAYEQLDDGTMLQIEAILQN